MEHDTAELDNFLAQYMDGAAKRGAGTASGNGSSGASSKGFGVLNPPLPSPLMGTADVGLTEPEPSEYIPSDKNETFWDVHNAIANAAHMEEWFGGGSLTDVDLSSEECQTLLMKTTYDEATLRLIAAVTRTNDDQNWSHVNLSGCREFVLPNVRRDGTRLRYASAALKNDLEVVQTAVNQ